MLLIFIYLFFDWSCSVLLFKLIHDWVGCHYSICPHVSTCHQWFSQNGCISSPVGISFPSKILQLGGSTLNIVRTSSNTQAHTSSLPRGPMDRSITHGIWSTKILRVELEFVPECHKTPGFRYKEERNFWSPAYSGSLMNASQLLNSKCSTQKWCQHACTPASWESDGSYRIDAKTGRLLKYCFFNAT